MALRCQRILGARGSSVRRGEALLVSAGVVGIVRLGAGVGGDNGTVRKVIRRRIRKQTDGLNVVGDVQGVVAANLSRSGATKRASTKSQVRIVQRNGKTQVTESYEHDHE